MRHSSSLNHTLNVNIRHYIIGSLSAIVAIAALAAEPNNIAEEVAWMVGDQPIYKSDIEEAYQQMLYERQPINGDPYCIIPEQLAIEKLFLNQADIDTVEISDSQISLEVDARINMLITNYGSKEKLEEYTHRPLPEFREQMAEMLKNRYRVDEVQRSLTRDVKSTPSDVRRYYNTLPQDSLPFVPMQVEVQIMTIKPTIPRQEIEDVKSRLRDFTERINSGESEFSTLAILYSEDPGSSVRGGEIGFMGRGHLEPEYAAVAFNLNDPKKVSRIVETQYGYHIIQLIEKRGDRINTRHILLRPRVSDAELIQATQRLDSIHADMKTGKFTFEEATAFISQDKDTRYNRGIMVNDQNGTTRFEMSQLPQEVARVVSNMQPGEISDAFVMMDPKSNSETVAIVKLTNRIEAHRANLSDDFQMIKDMYENSVKGKIVMDWIRKKINDTYVRIEEGWDNCEFQNQGWLKLRKGDRE